MQQCTRQERPKKQRRIRAAFIRGGTSKGIFFRASDLPTDPEARNAILLKALGSPDPYERQLDGLGGGLSSLSKAVMIAPSKRADADIDFTFAQVSVTEAFVDYAGTCGNLSSATGPFAVDEGLIEMPDGPALVRVFNTNTGKIFHARFDVADGEAVVEGAQRIPGVSTTGARVALEFLDPGGAMTGALLPTGAATNELDLGDTAGMTAKDGAKMGSDRWVRASLVDATNPIVIVRAADLGITTTEQPADLEAVPGLLDRLEAIRRAAGVRMGLAQEPSLQPETVPQAVPKIVVVAPPQDFSDLQGTRHAAASADISARAISMGRVHRALPLTLAMCLATACRIEGTVAADCLRGPLAPDADVRLASPSGVITAGADVIRHPSEGADAPGHGNAQSAGWHVERCRVIRTQRRLMEGHILV